MMDFLPATLTVNPDTLLWGLIWFGIRGAAVIAGAAFVVWFGGHELVRLIRICRDTKARVQEAFRR
jgi:hypothetical protein